MNRCECVWEAVSLVMSTRLLLPSYADGTEARLIVLRVPLLRTRKISKIRT